MLFSFAQDNLRFQCRYDRTVTTGANFDVDLTSPSPVIGIGQLAYDIEIDVGDLGGTSSVRITPNHDFESEISVRPEVNQRFNIEFQ